MDPRDLLDQFADALIAVSADGKVLFWSSGAVRVFGYAREEALGRSLVELIVPPEHRDEDRQRIRTAWQTGSASFEAVHGKKDGTAVFVDVSMRAVTDEAGKVTHLAISEKDVTQLEHLRGAEREKIGAALRIANDELEAFSYSVAHDLRAPLRAMNGFAQVLLEDHREKLDPAGLDCLHEIHDNALRMGALIDALLSLSRVGRAAVSPQNVDLTALARAVLAQLASADPKRRVDVVVHDSMGACIDLPLARTLLEHLLGNAWKFTGGSPAPRIEMGAAELNGARAFFVRDNGAGFDMEHAGRLFGPFQRLHIAGEFPGAGIGLATAQRIVHLHGGRIWAEAGAGAGATFYFTLDAQPPGRRGGA